MRRRVGPLLVALATALSACGDPPAPDGDAPADAVPPVVGPTAPWKPVAGRRGTAPWPTFADVTAGSGLDGFRLRAGPDAKWWLVQSVIGGLAAFDADGDGDMDLLLVDGQDMDVDGNVLDTPGGGTRLLRNDGAFRFADVTERAGLAHVRGLGLGAAACDWDGDGDQDLCVTGYDMLHLLRNRGDGTFEDVTDASPGLRRRFETTTACAFGDLDGDGRADLFLANYSDQRAWIERSRVEHPGKPDWCEARGIVVFCGPRGLTPQGNRLLLQREGGRFEDVTAAHVKEPAGHSFQPVMSDFDLDGDLDVYVANDATPNTLLVNDGKGRLTDRAVEAGCATNLNFEVQGSMGVAVQDQDRDGRPDVAVTNFVYEYNALWRNLTRPGGPPLFEDVSARTGFGKPPSDRVCWGVALLDFDADGELDAYIAGGHVYPQEESRPGGFPWKQRCTMFRGAGFPTFGFADVSAASGPHFADPRVWRGAVFPDLDDDGDADIVAVAQGDLPAVLRNDGGNANAWVRFDVRGKSPNRSAAGARVVVTADDGTVRVREVQHGSSYAASDDPRLLFGLGGATRATRVDVRWPDGTRTVHRDLELRRTHVLAQ